MVPLEAQDGAAAYTRRLRSLLERPVQRRPRHARLFGTENGTFQHYPLTQLSAVPRNEKSDSIQFPAVPSPERGEKCILSLFSPDLLGQSRLVGDGDGRRRSRRGRLEDRRGGGEEEEKRQGRLLLY
ncbi:MAG TPA: hypothetical protein VF547_07705 [Allosphingosinicella sp.]|jgi:hypothetical protein